ncbi:hypothetical protein ACJX0J_019931, partial [Zea mays]
GTKFLHINRSYKISQCLPIIVLLLHNVIIKYNPNYIVCWHNRLFSIYAVVVARYYIFYLQLLLLIVHFHDVLGPSYYKNLFGKPDITSNEILTANFTIDEVKKVLFGKIIGLFAYLIIGLVADRIAMLEAKEENQFNGIYADDTVHARNIKLLGLPANLYDVTGGFSILVGHQIMEGQMGNHFFVEFMSWSNPY